MGWLEKTIDQQRIYIEKILLKDISLLAEYCSEHWHNLNQLNYELESFLSRRQRITDRSYRLLYAINKSGQQYSNNISYENSDDSAIGQDLSCRPYLKFIEEQPNHDFILSGVYIDKIQTTHCITAIHSIKINSEIVGYIAADFDLKDLPLMNIGGNQIQEWQQLKGDPSIRSGLFQQTRSQSLMDNHIDETLKVIEILLVKQGVFHAKLHFSGSRASIWPYSDPYRYRVHTITELISPEMSLLYAKNPYPEQAVITPSQISSVLSIFKTLRETDETIYLRSASMNIMNGLIGLNFSCDGSHYMPVDEFLTKSIDFWFST